MKYLLTLIAVIVFISFGTVYMDGSRLAAFYQGGQSLGRPCICDEAPVENIENLLSYYDVTPTQGNPNGFTLTGINYLNQVTLYEKKNVPVVYIPPSLYNDEIECPQLGEGFDSPAGSGQQNPVTPADNKLGKKPSADPCDGEAAVEERLNKNSVTSANQQALSNTHNQLYNGQKVEYGYETKLTNLADRTIAHNPVRTDNNPSKIGFNTFWNPAHGYYVGYTHVHPQNSAPSPSDLYIGAQWYNQVPASERYIYTGYFTSTIITEHSVYVVTIKDAAKWATLANTSGEVHNKNYGDEILNYYNNGSQDRIAAAEYALLKLYGDAVNIYKAPNGSSGLDFKPLRLNSSNNQVENNPC